MTRGEYNNMIKLNDAEKKIAEALIYAQIASDAGKGIYELEGPDEKKTKAAQLLDYDGKDAFIEIAINRIRSKNTMFDYFIIYERDQNGAPSYITYFAFTVDEMKYQISFHIPKDKASEYIKSLEGTGKPMEWNRVKNGSRTACKVLLDILRENEENDYTGIK